MLKIRARKVEYIMKPILIVTHVDHEGPGYLAEVLERKAIAFRTLAIDRGEALPERATDFSGLVFMGGPMSVNDPLPWIEQELHLIRHAVDAAIPVLGHCLGGQLISKALGGTITRNAVREIGWFDVEQVADASNTPWLSSLPKRFCVFHWHGETFSIPAGATHVLRNSNCAHQAFAIGNTLALQCHIEMTASMVRAWIAQAPEEFVQTSNAVQPVEDIMANLSTRVLELQKLADNIYDAWLYRVTQK